MFSLRIRLPKQPHAISALRASTTNCSKQYFIQLHAVSHFCAIKSHNIKKINAGPSSPKLAVGKVHYTSSWEWVILSYKIYVQTANTLSSLIPLVPWEAKTLHNWGMSSPGLVALTMYLPHITNKFNGIPSHMRQRKQLPSKAHCLRLLSSAWQIHLRLISSLYW